MTNTDTQIATILDRYGEPATCVDAPLGAREIFRSGVARGQVLTCVRPLMRLRLTRRRPGWESEDQVQIRHTRLKRLSQSWFSRSRLSTVAPSLSCDPPTPRQPRGRDGADTAATGARYAPPLASSAQTIRAIRVGQRHPHQHRGLAGEHAPQPRASRDARARGPAGHRAGADDQQASKRALAHLRCVAEPLLAPARALNRGQPEPGRKV